MESDNSYDNIDKNFDIVVKLLEPVKPLGEEGSKFYLWKLDLIDILEAFKLPEKIKKRIILSKISDKYYRTCHQLYYVEENLTAVEFLDEIEELLGYDQLSHKNIDLIKKMKIGEKSIEEYNKEFLDLVLEIKPELRPQEKRLILYYIKGLNEKHKDILMNFIINFKSDQSLSQIMKFVLKHKNAYNDILDFDYDDKVTSVLINSDVFEQNTTLDELENIDISEDDATLYNLRFNSLLEKLQSEYRPDEQRLIYLYKKGIKENRILFLKVGYKKFETVKALMDYTLESYKQLEEYGALDDKDNIQNEEYQNYRNQFNTRTRGNDYQRANRNDSRRGKNKNRNYY